MVALTRPRKTETWLSSPSPARLFSKVDQLGGPRESPARMFFKSGTKARPTMTSKPLRTNGRLHLKIMLSAGSLSQDYHTAKATDCQRGATNSFARTNKNSAINPELQAEVWSQIVNFSRVFVRKSVVKMTEVWREYRNMVSVRLKRGARKDGALFVNKARVG